MPLVNANNGLMKVEKRSDPGIRIRTTLTIQTTLTIPTIRTIPTIPAVTRMVQATELALPTKSLAA